MLSRLREIGLKLSVAIPITSYGTLFEVNPLSQLRRENKSRAPLCAGNNSQTVRHIAFNGAGSGLCGRGGQPEAGPRW